MSTTLHWLLLPFKMSYIENIGCFAHLLSRGENGVQRAIVFYESQVQDDPQPYWGVLMESLYKRLHADGTV